MKLTKKQDGGISIIGNFDFKNYRLFKKEVSKIIKKYESNSNVDKSSYTISMKGMKTPYMKVCGWASRSHNRKTGEIKEVLFMDMDGPILYWLVKEELRFLQKKYDLPPFYVFASSPEKKDASGKVYGEYLIINLNKNTFQEAREIQKQSHCCDPSFKYVGGSNQYRTWITRIGNKGRKKAPKFKCIIGDLDKTYSQDCSKGHLEVLQGIYPDLPKVKYSNLDKSNVKDIYFNTYLTASL